MLDQDREQLRQLSNRIQALESRRPAKPSPTPKPQAPSIDVEARAKLERMKDQVSTLLAAKAEDNEELDRIHRQVASLKEDVDDLEERIEALEKRPPAVVYAGGGVAQAPAPILNSWFPAGWQ